jgi:hypothetical protein
VDDDCDGAADEEGNTFFLDGDRDGFGDAATSFNACNPPPSFVTNANDCCDQDPLAHPGQTGFFNQETRCGGFDYNCDAVETLGNEHIGSSCPEFLFGCNYDGWSDSVPGCGEEADLEDCHVPVITCSVRTIRAVQACR